MSIGIVGLGLIGGSMARAYKQSGFKVYGLDTSKAALDYAYAAGIINGELNERTIKACRLLFIALYPSAAEKYLTDTAPLIPRGCVVIDLCGTKRRICAAGFALAEKHGFTFIGGHPMAGTQFSGVKYSRSNLFRGAPMVLVPPVNADSELLDSVKRLLAPAGFASICTTTAQEHDRRIAFTSQLAHVVSNAYIKSKTAEKHGGFSAGSYKDLTRVAWLNEEMWTELFLENADNLCNELDSLISSLSEYRSAIGGKDGKALCALLRDGRIAKERIDGRGAANQ